ncbi:MULTISPECIES: DUF7283 family protein [Haloarcula]|uniref:DUF7283 family protein n=1 Tax=Haloarcula TaxID=2237 RepID=UPI0023E845D8|nr:hypothetical protein [Halomicroarcula sp. SHR3]
MDLEAPADAWYVFIGVSIISVAVAGVALGFPSGLSPDAEGAMNQINEVAGSNYEEYGKQDHRAEQFWVDGKRIGLKNQYGTSTSSVRFGTLAPVHGNDKLAEVLASGSINDTYTSKSTFRTDVETAQDSAFSDGDPAWRSASGQLRVRKVTWGDASVTLVDF